MARPASPSLQGHSPAVDAATTAQPPSAQPQSAPAVSALGACVSGGTGPSSLPASPAFGPEAGRPSALYNSQVEPFAVLTGPYAYVAGGAALRDLGYGYINLAWPGGSTKNLVAAYMIWSIMDDSLPPQNATLNGVNVTGTWSAYATPSPCWSPTYIYTFVADVTDIIVNGNNTLTNFPSGVTNGGSPWIQPQTDPMDEGATLVAVYSNESLATHAVTVYSGALTTEGVTLTAELDYATAVSTQARTTYVVADGQLSGNEAIWNTTVVDSNAFNGTAPKDTSIAWSEGDLYDTKTYNVTVANNSSSTSASVASDGSDCLTWIGQVVDVQVAPAKPPYKVVFQEQGLVNGTQWNVTTNGTPGNGTVKDGTSSISFELGNGTYTFSVGRIPGYTTTEHSGSYTVEGGAVYIRILFHQVFYPVSISETGLPPSDDWWVTVANVSQGLDEESDYFEAGSSIVYALPNGTYNLTPGAGDLYTAHPPLSTFTVDGAAAFPTVTFAPPELFNVTFVEHGLPAGTAWGGSTFTNWGTFDNATSKGSFVLALPNTSDEYDYIYPSQVPGFYAKSTIYFVVPAAPVTVDVNYSTLFNVTFTESGLAHHTEWVIELEGASGYSSNTTYGASDVFAVPNGSYTFSVGAVWGYTVHPVSGEVNVTGANVTQAITFVAEPTYALTFTESGLSPGTSWSVEVELPNFTELYPTSTTPTITLMEPNGSFYFDVASVAGYDVSPAYGDVSIDGAAVSEAINFSRVYTVEFTETGLPTGIYWEVNLGEQYLGSYSPSLNFSVANGTYAFDVYEEDVFEPTPSSGSVKVDGVNLMEAIVFSSPGYPTYQLEFTETGLPAGTNWSVSIGEFSVWSVSSSLNYTEENGSFWFGVYSSNDAYTPTPGDGEVTISGGPQVEPISFASSAETFEVTLTETGLPVGTEWWVNITDGPSLHAESTTIATALSNATYDYTVGCLDKSYASPASSFTVAGSALPVSVPFTLVVFAVTFTESGLPSGTEWYANVTGEPSLSSSTATISTSLPNGSYPYLASSANLGFVAPGGRFTVAGAPASVSVPFSAAFAVTFTESGLPSGTTWFVNVSGAGSRSGSGSSIVVPETNGSHDYTVATVDKQYSAPGGSFQVNGAPVSVSVPFTLLTFTVTFTESGLPSGVEWYANLTGQASLGSTTTVATTSLPNGTYPFGAATVDKSYEAHPGPFRVDGAAVRVQIVFSLVTFEVTFTESGLPSGAEWLVNITGQSPLSSTTTTITVALPNGSYAFTVATTEHGYTSHNASTVVQGQAVSVAVKFQGSPSSGSSSFLGLPGADGYLALGLIVAMLLVLMLLLIFGRRKKKRKEESPGSPPEGAAGPPPAAGT